MNNPLFPSDTPKQAAPTPPPTTSRRLALDNNPAANLVRRKIAALYAKEPDAKAELAEAKVAGNRHSKHQQFIGQLQTSGKSLAEIQTAWHEYYVALSDEDKHAVWQEFYAAADTSRWSQYFRSNTSTPAQPTTPQPIATPVTSNSGVTVSTHEPLMPPTEEPANIRARLRQHIQANGRLKPKQHLHSLAFGLASGLVVVVIFLFGFFNEVIIAPFIQPSKRVSNAPLIIDSKTVATSSTPQIIIPKINLEIPVDYTQNTTSESVIEGALDNGIVHYPITAKPGQNGNAAFFGHSSNNIFNPGKYKFAFVLLHKVVNGDTFYVTYEGKVYAYQVISHKVVPPTEVSVLTDTHGRQATATLITCDPPGTSINRLVVTGVQISPTPGGDTAPVNTPPPTQSATSLPGNGPSLWSRLWNSIF